MNHIVIIGDIAASRQLSDRKNFQQGLKRHLAATTRRARILASPYTLTLGDEFQAVYRKAETLFADLIGVMAEIHPARLRVSIGVGRLTTSVNPKQALGMDGPAFYAARAGLDTLKQGPDLLRVNSDCPDDWELANYGLNLVTRPIRKWDRNRLVVLAALLRGTSVPKIAATIGISKVAVYKNINAAALDDVVGLFRTLSKKINGSLPS